MSAGISDQNLIRFWPLAEIRPVADPAAHAEGYFIFADYSISAHEYGIHLSMPSRYDVGLIGGALPIIVAKSFTQFLSAYLSDPMSIFRG
jgi:hypothetical protein